MRRITVGGGAMTATVGCRSSRVRSGEEKVHLEAPKAPRLAKEMPEFLDWFNNGPEVDPVLKADRIRAGLDPPVA
jgi:hypothetical protein